MGGHAFPDIARLSSSEHAQLVTVFRLRLAHLFDRVDVAPVDPGKLEHGDVDLLVFDEAQVSDQDVSHALEATEFVSARPTSNFAVRLDHGRLAQVDVRRCATEQELDNEIVLRTGGQLYQILNDIALETGLALLPSGLYPASKPPHFLLTPSATEALRFFGLDTDRHAHGFREREEMFIWIEAAVFLDGPLVRFRRSRRSVDAWELVRLWQERREADACEEGERASRADVFEAALDHFDRRAAYEVFKREQLERLAAAEAAQQALRKARQARLATKEGARTFERG